MRLPGVPPESDVVEAMSNGTGSRLTLDHGRFDRALFERLRKKVLHYVEDGNTKRLTFWRTGDPVPSEPLTYVKTTYNNKPIPQDGDPVLAMLDSGDLWNCDHAPGSHLCPNLHEAASLWYEGLRVLPALRAWRGYRRDDETKGGFGDVLFVF
eukprot:g675.t1